MTHSPVQKVGMLISALLLGGAAAAAPGWIPDASKATLPKTRVAGKIHGKPFRVEKAEVQSSTPSGTGAGMRTTHFLHLSQGKEFFADYEFVLFLLTRGKQRLDGKTYQVDPRGVFEMPGRIEDQGASYPLVQGIHMKWKVPGKQFGDTDMDSKFTLRLTFGKEKAGKLPGTLYLCMQDAQKSYVAGTFTAVVKH